MIFQLIYASIASSRFKRCELDDILALARRNNERDDLSGVLIYANSSFLQVLEGPYANVINRFESISRDDRHEWIFRLREGMVKSRNFPNWSMGLHECAEGDQMSDAISIFKSTADVLGVTQDSSDALVSTLNSFAKMHFRDAA